MTILTSSITRYLHKAPFTLEAMSLELPELTEPHPNRIPFRGVLTKVDEPSTRPPGGAQGHRVLIPRHVAEAAGDTIVGMPVDCAWNLKDHDKKRNIGVITGWEIQGHDFIVNGHLFGKNYPDDVTDIQQNKDHLGMSYEVSDVEVVDVNSPVWTLDHFLFTGGAILEKNSAAYAQTSIAAAAEAEEIAMEHTAVLDALRTINAKIDVLSASADESDEEAARRDEEEASRHDEEAATAFLAAKRARDDDDEEDASRHDDMASAARSKAYMARAKALAAHKALAAAKREAGDEDAAKHHDEEAARLEAADAKCHEEDAAAASARETANAARLEAAKREADEEAMADMLAAFMQARGHEEEAAATTQKDPKTRKVVPMDDDWMAMFMRAAMKAMTFQPGVTMGRKKQQAAAEHDDEEQDKALIRRMLQKKQGGNMTASANDVQTRRELRELRASVELLTDTVKRMSGLMTDTMQGKRTLATDTQNGANGGAYPTRRTMAAHGELWADKYGRNADGTPKQQQGKMTLAQLQQEFKDKNITDTIQQMARTLELQAAGNLIAE